MIALPPDHTPLEEKQLHLESHFMLWGQVETI